MSDDHSPGDRRTPYSNVGGQQGRHAQTHDVRREELTNPSGPEPVDTSFEEQMAPGTTGGPRLLEEDVIPAVDDKVLHERLPELNSDELARLSIVGAGSHLEQGVTYIDLNRLAEGPFKALAGHVVNADDRMVSKRETDYELWNRLVGRDTQVEIERPAELD